MKYILHIITLIIATAALGVGLYNWFSAPKTAYINLATVYGDFKYTRQLEKKLQEVKTARQNLLDSLKLEVEMLSRQLENEKNRNGALVEKYTLLRDEYVRKDQFFSQSNTQLAEQYTEQVWEQINQYVKDFAGEKGYTYLFGANSSGSLMYAAEEKNVTKEVTEYINARFEGKK